MKFVVSSTDLIMHLQSISKVSNSISNYSILDNYLIQFGYKSASITNEFNFSELYSDYNFLLKLIKPDKEEIRISKYEKKKDRLYNKYQIKFKSTVSFHKNEALTTQTQKLEFRTFLTGSIKQLMRQMLVCMGHIQSNLFSVLRNTRIHTLSIFFGLCCSRSGYIFEALAGTSSHPIPVK